MADHTKTPEKKYLDRRTLLGFNDLATEEVEIPQLGGVVRIRELSAQERDSFEQSCMEGSGKNARMNMTNVRAKLVALTAVNADGGQLFVESDVKLIGKKSSRMIDKLFGVAQRLSGLTDTDVKELSEALG